MAIVLKVKKLDNCTGLPFYQTEGSAGMDLYAGIETSVEIKSLERKLIPTGIAVEIPANYEAQIRPRSGLSIKNGITLINCVGTIDSDYRGEICVGLVNLSNTSYTIQPGERIAQMVISPVVQAEIECVSVLEQTKRADGGFGSTGKL